MARASIPTILSLDRFAAIIGLNPAHFNGAAGGTIMPAAGSCGQVWYQYDWQAVDRVSRESLARAIAEAERQMASQLGYWPGPKYSVADVYRYPRHHRRDVLGNGLNVGGHPKSVRLKRGKFIQAGQRASTLVVAGTAVTYSSPDGDSYNELATITVALPAGVTDPCEVKVYFAGKGGAPAWEVRPPISKAVIGANVVATFYAWQLIDPDLWGRFPNTDGLQAIDLNAAAVYETTVDVYREFTDFSEVSAKLYWEPQASSFINGICSQCGGDGCEVCTLTVQDGCIHVREVLGGWVVPTAGSYDTDTGLWTQEPWTLCREPDLVKLFYLSGDQSDEYLNGETCEAMPEEWARLVAMLAVCKLERPLCSCKQVQTLVAEWRTDIARATADADSYGYTDEILRNPFGTRKGEVQAWKAVFGTAERRVKGGAVG